MAIRCEWVIKTKQRSKCLLSSLSTVGCGVGYWFPCGLWCHTRLAGVCILSNTNVAEWQRDGERKEENNGFRVLPRSFCRHKGKSTTEYYALGKEECMFWLEFWLHQKLYASHTQRELHAESPGSILGKLYVVWCDNLMVTGGGELREGKGNGRLTLW